MLIPAASGFFEDEKQANQLREGKKKEWDVAESSATMYKAVTPAAI